jgi:hypothetical protein
MKTGLKKPIDTIKVYTLKPKHFKD